MITIAAGETVIKDPDAERVYTWPWSEWLPGGAAIDTSQFIVSTIAGDAAPLVADYPSVSDDNDATHVRLTGGTLGAVYTVTNRIVTSGSPAETDDRSIKVKIAAQ